MYKNWLFDKFISVVFRLLRRGSMFVYSQQQFRNLLGIDELWKAGSMLDLGQLINIEGFIRLLLKDLKIVFGHRCRRRESHRKDGLSF